MVFGSSLFEEGLRQANLRGGTQSLKCSLHQPNPKPIRHTADRAGPLLLYQFRLSLREQAYLRFCKVEYKVRNISFPTMQVGSGAHLPILRDGQYSLPPDMITTHLRKNYEELNLEAKLSGGRRADVEAFTCVVDEKLAPLLRVSQYLEDKSYESTTKQALIRAIPFPLSLYISGRERKQVQREAQARGIDLSTLAFSEVIARARRIYDQLDKRLGATAGVYFFGSEPTSFDAALFGHLGDALMDMHFTTIVPLYPNLLNYFHGILDLYFSETVDVRLAGSEETSLSWARTNYMNSLNRFNQLDKLRCVAPVASAPMLDKYYDEAMWKVKEKEVVKTKAETEEERAERRRNSIWLGVVGTTSLLFMVAQSIATLFGDVGVEEEEEEEEAEE